MLHTCGWWLFPAPPTILYGILILRKPHYAFQLALVLPPDLLGLEILPELIARVSQVFEIMVSRKTHSFQVNVEFAPRQSSIACLQTRS